MPLILVASPFACVPWLGFHDLGWYEFLYLTFVKVPAFLVLNRKPRSPGFRVVSFVALYTPARFLLDFLRGPDPTFGGLTPAQWAIAAVPSAPPVGSPRADVFCSRERHPRILIFPNRRNDPMDQVSEALYTSAGMLWKALWALSFGYIVSSIIQVVVTREQMGRMLGSRGPKQGALATLFGFVSSSCSFAALAASRAVFTKGAHPSNAITFLVASTNLVIELGLVLLVLLSWHFVVGNFMLGLLMIVYAYGMTRIWLPERLAEDARRHAEDAQAREGREGSSDQGEWKRKLASLAGWRAIADAYFFEWKMVWKEILFGFTVAGFISVYVPQSFWNSLFIEAGSDTPSLIAVMENAAIAPIIAFFTFIGSMGNVPLAAMLWSKEASFGGVMSFLGADLVAATVVYIHAKYYGWRYAAYLSVLLYLAMVAAGVTVHYAFAGLGILPTARPTLREMVAFQVDYTLWLNLTFVAAGVALLLLRRTEASSHQLSEG